MLNSRTNIPGFGGRYRSIYNDIKKPGIISTPSYLRLESAALGTQGTVSFTVLKNESPAASTTERRLSLTDSFTIVDMGFFIFKVASGSTNAVNPLNTWPDSVLYSGSSEAVNLLNLYNGSLGITVDGVTIIDSMDLMRFYRVPSAQKGVGLSTYDATNNPNNKYLNNGWDSANFGFAPLTPTVELSGARKNVITVTCPQSVAMAGTSSSNYACLMLRGFLNQNAANFR